jgi:hypothetical protein
VSELRYVMGLFLLVGIFFGVPAAATLLAAKLGLPHRLVGWATLVFMAALAYFFYGAFRRSLLGNRKPPPARPRRSHRRL